jgi:hypothetical protein
MHDRPWARPLNTSDALGALQGQRTADPMTPQDARHRRGFTPPPHRTPQHRRPPGRPRKHSCILQGPGRGSILRARMSRTLKVRGGIISQANRYLGGFCSSQRIFPPQIIQVLLMLYERDRQSPTSAELSAPMALWPPEGRDTRGQTSPAPAWPGSRCPSARNSEAYAA